MDLRKRILLRLIAWARVPHNIVLNQLITSRTIRKVAEARHRTGIQNNDVEVRLRSDKLLQIMEPLITGSGERKNQKISILELGPGQSDGTIKTITERIRAMGIEVDAFVVDIRDYFGISHWRRAGIHFLSEDALKAIDEKFDLIFSHDVLEHVTYPESLVETCYKALSPNGLFYNSWDLRDHLNLSDERKWFYMHFYSPTCFKLMLSNRSSYTNRLNYRQWMSVFDANGFSPKSHDTKSSRIAREYMTKSFNLQLDDVYRVEALFEKK